MKKALIYGGGKIGRGFIGVLFSHSGYLVTFINRNHETVRQMNVEGCYGVRYVSSFGFEDEIIKPVNAVEGTDPEAVARAISECDIMATSVGTRAMESIVPFIVSGLRKRWNQNRPPLNIIICENIMDANLVLEQLIRSRLTKEEQTLFETSVGLVEASIGRMVPIQTEEMTEGDPLRVCVERYGFLPVDKAAFKGEIPCIENMVPYAPFEYYVKRKLYIHNMGHATCAYLGSYLGLTYICQSIDIAPVRIIVHNAMIESAVAMSKRYGVDIESIINHVDDLLYRFTNKALGDTCERVGADPERKLSPVDRLIGATSEMIKQNIPPVYISVGTAAAVYRYISEHSEYNQSEESASEILHSISQISGNCPAYDIILGFYRMLLDKKTAEEILKSADEIKHRLNGDII